MASRSLNTIEINSIRQIADTWSNMICECKVDFFCVFSVIQRYLPREKYNIFWNESEIESGHNNVICSTLEKAHLFSSQMKYL